MQYSGVGSGDDLIRLGIIPKDASRLVSLIVKKRLEGLRDSVRADINDEMLGTWYPAITQGTNITDPEMISRTVRQGMKVRSRNDDLEGKVIAIGEGDRYQVEWQARRSDGTSLSGKVHPGYGTYENPDTIILLTGKDYELLPGAVVDPKLGHKARFSKEYRGRAFISGTYGSETADVMIPQGTTAVLAEYKGGTLRIALDNPLQGNRKNFTFNLQDLYGNLEVSSLGQEEPADKEGQVMTEVLLDFFPHTVLNTMAAKEVLVGLLMGKDMVLHGPPGSGKTNLARDIIGLAENQDTIFTVDGCQVQCNPYSVFDPEYAKIVPPCPECMIKYDPGFRETGIFHPPKPSDVKVRVAKFGEGFGIEFVEGTIQLNRMHLTGYKLPKLDGSTTEGRESEYDPEGFHAGVLSRTNNGLLHMDELDKLRPQALDGILEALENERVKPDQLRFSYPANGMVIGTSNTLGNFSGALNDRMVYIFIGYPEDADVSYEVTKRAYHKDKGDVREVEIGDTHTMVPIDLRQIPMPVTVERAVDVLYMKFRAEYDGPGKNEITASNRAKLDALDAARARLLLEDMFTDAGKIATEEYAIYGISYAFKSRVSEDNPASASEMKEKLAEWVKAEFPKILQGEEDVWWCKVYRHIGVLSTQVPQAKDKFQEELAAYEMDPSFIAVAHQRIKDAYATNQNFARLLYPFMDFMYSEQPGFAGMGPVQTTQLVSYLLDKRADCSCR